VRFHHARRIKDYGAPSDVESMKNAMKLIVIAVAFVAMLAAQQTKGTVLMTRDLPELAGKQGTMLTVEYAPGASGDVHRHNAQVFVYVLEGSIVMQVKDGKQVTLDAGATFYEGPKDIHTVGRNASKTKPAKFLVFMVKDKDAPISVPIK
jgi:quercetin dioxygenase-like cupin family protein